MGHDFVFISEQTGNCTIDTIKAFKCSRCPEKNHERIAGPAVHNFVEGTSDPIWSDEAEGFVTHEIEYCTRCYANK